MTTGLTSKLTNLLTILLVALVVPVGVHAKNACAATHGPLAEIQSGLRAPTLDEAMDIVGDHLAPVQVRNALDHIYYMPLHAFKARVENARILFEAIKRRQYFTWKFEKFTAEDGSVGYVGDQGYFVLFKADGRIMKGTFRIERDLNDYSEWNGHSDSIYEYHPKPAVAPVATVH